MSQIVCWTIGRSRKFLLSLPGRFSTAQVTDGYAFTITERLSTLPRSGLHHGWQKGARGMSLSNCYPIKWATDA